MHIHAHTLKITKILNIKYDISDTNSNSNNKNYVKIKNLFIKYFLTPKNLFQVLNYNGSNKINKITFICLSNKSFYN